MTDNHDQYLKFDQNIIKFFSTATDNEKETREVIEWIDLLTKFKDYLLNLNFTDAINKLVKSMTLL